MFGISCRAAASPIAASSSVRENSERSKRQTSGSSRILRLREDEQLRGYLDDFRPQLCLVRRILATVISPSW